MKDVELIYDTREKAEKMCNCYRLMDNKTYVVEEINSV